MIKVSQFCVAYGPYVSMGFSILCKGKDPTPSVVPPSIKIQIPDLPKWRSVSRSLIILPDRHSRKKLFHELLQKFLFKLPKLPEFEVSMSDFLLLVDLGLFLNTIYSAYHYTLPAPEVQPGVVAPDAPHPPSPPLAVALNNGVLFRVHREIRAHWVMRGNREIRAHRVMRGNREIRVHRVMRANMEIRVYRLMRANMEIRAPHMVIRAHRQIRAIFIVNPILIVMTLTMTVERRNTYLVVHMVVRFNLKLLSYQM